MASEKNFENKVKKYLKNNGVWLVKYWAGAAYTKSGIPDLLVCCNGYFLGIEVKAETGKPSELQLYNLRQIQAAGGAGILLYPRHFEQFKDFIRCLRDGVYLNELFNTGAYPFLTEWDHINKN